MDNYRVTFSMVMPGLWDDLTYVSATLNRRFDYIEHAKVAANKLAKMGFHASIYMDDTKVGEAKPRA